VRATAGPRLGERVVACYRAMEANLGELGEVVENMGDPAKVAELIDQRSLAGSGRRDSAGRAWSGGTAPLPPPPQIAERGQAANCDDHISQPPGCPHEDGGDEQQRAPNDRDEPCD
jgi:hypothetical protein